MITSWRNPFQTSSTLSSLSTGVKAPGDLMTSLHDAHKFGTQAAQTFLDKRVISNDDDFYAAIPKMKLMSFSGLTKKFVRISDKTVVLKADRSLFARMAVIAQSRSMDMKTVLSFSLGPLPWSLANVDGSLAKTPKSKLLHLLESTCEARETDTPPNTAWLIDRKAFFQSMSNVPATIGGIADHLWKMVSIHVTAPGSRVDFVVDQYPDISIKSGERSKRARSGSVVTAVTRASQPSPKQWKKFPSLGANKSSL